MTDRPRVHKAVAISGDPEAVATMAAQMAFGAAAAGFVTDPLIWPQWIVWSNKESARLGIPAPPDDESREEAEQVAADLRDFAGHVIDGLMAATTRRRAGQN
jgi:hypothetical protein